MSLVNHWWSVPIWLLLGFAVFWAALVLALWLAQRRLPDAASLKEAELFSGPWWLFSPLP